MSLKSDVNELIERIERIEQKLKIFYVPHAVEQLEWVIESLDTRTLQQVLREVDARELVFAMIGFKQKALLQIKNAMSKAGWKMLVDDMAYHMEYASSGFPMRDARIHVMGVIKQMQSMGEIVIGIPSKSTFGKLSKKENKKLEKEYAKEKKRQDREFKSIGKWKKEVFDLL